MWAPEVPMEAKNAMSSGGTAPAFSKSCLDLCAKSCTSCGLIVPQAHLSSKDVPSSDEASLVVVGSSPASLCLMPPFLLFFVKGSPDIPMAEAKGTKLCTVRKEQRLNSFTMDMLVGMLCWEADSGNLHSHSNHNQTCHMNTKNSWAQEPSTTKHVTWIPKTPELKVYHTTPPILAEKLGNHYGCKKSTGNPKLLDSKLHGTWTPNATETANAT